MITLKEYQARRIALAKQLPKHSIALIPAATEQVRNGDVHYRFRQNSDFYYLTGCHEADACLVIVADRQESILFLKTWDPVQTIWTGEHLSVDDAPHILGVDAAYDVARIDELLTQLLADTSVIYYPVGRRDAWESIVLKTFTRVKEQTRKGVQSPTTLCDISPLISEMRVFKSNAEIALIQHAVDISVRAHEKAMQQSTALQYEFELEALLRYEFIRHGCQEVAYDPIVAGGENACTLHYTANNQALPPKELMLIDAGAEFQNYAADITRTFPLNGQFSSHQRQLYDLVLHAQRQAIACIKPNAHWDDMQQIIIAVLTQGLVDLGILKGQVDTLIETGAYRAYYMHSSGHWLGLDVHDAGQYKLNAQWRALKPGMVLTVEPGLYIPSSADVPSHWRGIGIRIEDDILVTHDGARNLSQALVRDADDIEALIRG